ncbi:MAG: ADP-ribosylglycohydrolase family protein [Hyphomicrobiales bacterium]
MEKIQEAVLASFIGDALSLGVHWIYDTRIIEKEFGDITGYTSPLPNSYHPTKSTGQLTHYGDQELALLESLSCHKTFYIDKFIEDWTAKLNEYSGYRDHATKITLRNINQGIKFPYVGSQSNELGGVCRIPPLFLLAIDNDKILEMALEQTQFTHNSPVLLKVCSFIVELCFAVISGSSILEGIETVKKKKEYKDILELVDKAVKSKGKRTRTEIKRFGQMCSVRNAFPSLIHLLVSYEDDPKAGLIENLKAGGDSAARSILYSFIMGLKHGIGWMDEQWIKDLQEKDKIKDLFSDL